MTITARPRWSLGRGKPPVPSGWQATPGRLHARGLHTWIAPGLTGVALVDDDPLVDQWTVVLPCGLDVPDQGSALPLSVWRDADVVTECARLLGLALQ